MLDVKLVQLGLGIDNTNTYSYFSAWSVPYSTKYWPPSRPTILETELESEFDISYFST